MKQTLYILYNLIRKARGPSIFVYNVLGVPNVNVDILCKPSHFIHAMCNVHQDSFPTCSSGNCQVNMEPSFPGGFAMFPEVVGLC